MIFTLLLISLMIFYTASLVPATSRASLFISPNSYSSSTHSPWDSVPIIIERYGLDEPFYIQYLNWLKFLLTEGSLGYSYWEGKWVSDAILSSFPATFELVMYSAPIIIFGGIKLGVYAAKREREKNNREDAGDFLVRGITTLGYSVPLFFTSLLALSIFFLNLHWVSPGRLGGETEFFIIVKLGDNWKTYTGLYTIDALLNGQFWIFIDALRHLVLPVAVLTVSLLPVVVRVTRASMQTELNKIYATAARAKGLREVEVINRVKRNAMIPILTISSVLFGSMLTGIVVVEDTFGIGGIGSLAIGAAERYDFPLLIGISLFFCIIFVAINLLVDIIYTYLDPRVKL